MGMVKEFKEFVARGNVMDMAIGIVLGAAFGAITKSMVDDVLMPPVGLLLGGVDFSNLFVVLREGLAAGPYITVADAMPLSSPTASSSRRSSISSSSPSPFSSW